MLEALSGLVLIGLPIAVGYLLARAGLLDQAAGKQFNLLVFYVLIPFMLFDLMSRAQPRDLLSPLSLTSLLAALAMFGLYVLATGLGRRLDRGCVTIGALAAGYTNAGHIGLPVAIHLLGDATYVAPVILFQTCLFAPVGLAILRGAAGPSPADGRWPRWWLALRPALAPVTVGSLSGLAVSLSGWSPPRPLADAVALIGGAAVPVVLIAFGLSLRGRRLLDQGPDRAQALLASGLKLVAMPLTAGLLGRFGFGLVGHDLYVVTVLAALPTALNVFNFASRHCRGLVVARDTISLTTAGAAPVILLIAALLG
ncbi:MAG: AEC family transporter [Propionibacteriaceae bacterium]|jgi:predicted permease|nr:AEC family transporter [Propionibacteriaceae bacterium]